MHIELNVKNLNETEAAVQEILMHIEAVRKLASQINWKAVGVEMTIADDSNAMPAAEPEETDCDINIMEFPGETEHSGTVRVWFETTSPGWRSLQESVGWKLFLKELALAQKL